MQERIHLLSASATPIRPKHSLPTKPASFGVYLGHLNTPIAHKESQLLSRWDAVVLNYCEPGVLEAVNDESVPFGSHIIARLDLLQVLKFAALDNEVDMLRAVYLVSKIIRQTDC